MLVANLVSKVAKEKIQNLFEGIVYMKTHEVQVGAKGEHADLLYLHEAGVPSKNIPPRPVIQPALSESKTRSSMKAHMRTAMVSVILRGRKGKGIAENELHKVGMIGRDACKEWITDGTHLAPNSPITIARKGSSTPLIDTGALLNSITYEIKGK